MAEFDAIDVAGRFCHTIQNSHRKEYRRQFVPTFDSVGLLPISVSDSSSDSSSVLIKESISKANRVNSHNNYTQFKVTISIFSRYLLSFICPIICIGPFPIDINKISIQEERDGSEETSPFTSFNVTGGLRVRKSVL